MNRIDRLSSILIQLQSKKVVTAREIADRFEISLRTVYRDIRSLEQAGIPIGAEAGVGYFLCEEYHLPPVIFTQEEASSFLLAEKLITKMSDLKVNKAFESALFKVKSVLKSNEKEYLAQLSNKIEVLQHDTPTSTGHNLFLLDIQKALANKCVLEVEYTAFYNKKTTTRIIEPVSLCHYGMRWHLIAYCRLRDDYRDFRLDRLVSVEIMNEHYNDQNHLSLSDYFKRLSKDQTIVNIKLRISKKMAKSLSPSKYWLGWVEENEIDDSIEMSFANSDLNYFSKWVLGIENEVQILFPEKLRDIIKKQVTNLHEYYSGSI